jgi:hypothetical protein
VKHSALPSPATFTFSVPVPTIVGGTLPSGLAITTPAVFDRGVISMSGNVKMILGTYTFSTSYTTGGEAFVLPPLAQKIIWCVLASRGGYVFVVGSGVVKAYNPGAGAGALVEVTAGTNLNTLGAVEFLAVTY